MSNVTVMTWAGVSVSGSSTNVGKSIPITYTASNNSRVTLRYTNAFKSYFTTSNTGAGAPSRPADSSATVLGTFDLDIIPSTNTNFPVEIMLASGQSFSAVCDAYNAVVIREDGA